MKHLLYTCCFHREIYYDMLQLLIKSYKKFNHSNNVDFLVYTNNKFINQLKSEFDDILIFDAEEKKKYETAYSARLDIFDYDKINDYDKIIYIDTDIIITGNINLLFDKIIDDKLYAVKEGNIMCDTNYWGRYLFDSDTKNCDAFNSGTMGFFNSEKMKTGFECVKNLINKEISMYGKTKFYDQPIIVYYFISNDLYNNNDFNNLVSLHAGIDKVYDDIIINHFSGDMGHREKKLEKMKYFYNILLGFD